MVGEKKKSISPVTDPIRVDAASSSVSADNKEDEEKRVSLKDKLREKLRIKLKSNFKLLNGLNLF